MRILLPTGDLDPRIAQDPRVSRAQKAAITAAGRADERARFVGLDAKMRPVVAATLAGPGRTEYALLRNGDPVKVERPLAEEWPDRGILR